MKLGRVTGNVVSTISNPIYDQRKLLLCDLIDERGRASGDYLIAVDAVGAGWGETVLVLDEGNGARQVLNWPEGAVRAVVVGIVDDIDLTGYTRRR